MAGVPFIFAEVTRNNEMLYVKVEEKQYGVLLSFSLRKGAWFAVERTLFDVVRPFSGVVPPWFHRGPPPLEFSS